MAIDHLVARYGLAAIFIGAGVEGETLVVAGGAFAHRELISLWAAILAAAAGSFVADQLFFLAGRHYRDHRLVVRIIAKPAFAKAFAAFERHPTGFILIFRFLYGLRTVSPVAIGTSQVRSRTFMSLNAISAAIWAALFTWIGYAFGGRIADLIGRFIAPQHLPLAIGAMVLCLLAVAQTVRWLHHRHA